MTHENQLLETPLGVVSIEGLESVRVVRFLDEPPAFDGAGEETPAVAQLREFFGGKRTTFELELNPQGTDFQRAVWREVARIPFGETRTYLEIAEALGDRNLTRAVGAANGANPIAIVIPCHRVIGTDGSLTGYAGGLRRKRWLLDHESSQTTLW